MSSLYPSDSSNFVIEHSQLMRDSFLHITGHSLMADNFDEATFAENLYNAPFALVSHDTAEDPVFNYANQTALKLFEFSWEEFVLLPSRLSAESVDQAERARLLAEVASKGFIRDYRGLRISKTGKRFLIKKAIVWNLLDAKTGLYKGQAACFRRWVFIE
jgi:hypothetical protein